MHTRPRRCTLCEHLDVVRLTTYYICWRILYFSLQVECLFYCIIIILYYVRDCLSTYGIFIGGFYTLCCK